MITIQRADSKVSAFLGEKKGISNGDRIRPSIYIEVFSIADKSIVYNTLTEQCIETKYYSWFEKPEVREYDDQDNEMRALVNANFLVAENFDEASRYFKILDILRKTESSKAGYSGYTILPTTSCNARCVYCFESGVEYETMDDKTVKQTIQYIKDTHRKGSRISLHWFGGEPLVGKLIITRICKALQKEGIKYRSDMISNGSLMTEELAKIAKDDWHLGSVQITLDGREEIYCERKRYVSFNGSPYRAVLNGIHALLAQGIRVSIRLNVDEDNLEELHKLVDELEEEFSKENNISIYCHSIFLEEDDAADRDNEKFYQDMEKLNDRLTVFNDNRIDNKKELSSQVQEPIDDANIKWDEDEEEIKADQEAKKGRYYDRRGRLRRYYCMADNPAAGPVILPNGNMNTCEHIGELPVVGTIFDTNVVDKHKYVEKKRPEIDKCLKCSLLPKCTDFSGCPTNQRDCYKELLAVEKRKFRSFVKATKLPPITISYDDKIIRIKEPTRDLAEKCTEYLVPDYYKSESTVSSQDAAKIIGIE